MKSAAGISIALVLAIGCLATVSVQSDDRAEPVVLINPFTVPADKLDETLAMWEQARNFLQQQPGYISTALHQSIATDAQYRLINVAQWQSVEAFKTATDKMRREAMLPRIEGVVPHPDLYTVVRRD